MVKMQFGKNLNQCILIIPLNWSGVDANFCEEKRILSQTICPNAQQQNVTVERKHYHLPWVAHSLLIQANIPTRFWREAILIAVYLINITPTLRQSKPFRTSIRKDSHRLPLTSLWMCSLCL